MRSIISRNSRYYTIELLLLILAMIAGSILMWCTMDPFRNISMMVFAGVVFTVSLLVAIRLIMDPDRVRARQSNAVLTLASEILEVLADGLNEESAQRVCEVMLPVTNGVAVAITDKLNILGYAGIYEEDNPHGLPIRTAATKETLADGETRVMLSPQEIGFMKEVETIKAAIIVPLMVSGKVEGTLKFYYSTPRFINETQRSVAEGFAKILSAQLAASALENQKKLATSMELKALQSQINPHFLFNTLNTIAAMTRTDPDNARFLLREFAVFYRKTLEDSSDLIALDREVEQTCRYFTFETARFGDERLELDVDIPDDVKDIVVPAFMLQPIVENSVRHAMPSEGKLTIRVTARRSGDDLVVIVADNGVGMTEEKRNSVMHPKSDTGLGIAMNNINERVLGYFGKESTMEIESKAGCGTTVTFFLKEGAVYDHA